MTAQSPPQYPAVAIAAGSHPAITLPETDAENPRFLHALLCQLGLPRRRIEARRFERRSGAAALLIEAGEAFDGKRYQPQPIPAGPIPRLIMIQLCTQAVRTRKRVLDIGHSTRDFMRTLNISQHGRNMAAFRKHMMALSVCKMTMAFLDPSGVIKQRNFPPVDAFDASLVDKSRQRSLWPSVLEISEKFYDTLVDHAVPLNADALAQLHQSALSLDAYTWLAHRLCRVRENGGSFLTWGNLQGQFGDEYTGKRCLNDFQKKFKPALERALKAYPEGRIDFVSGGIRIYPSPPPVKKSQVLPMRAKELKAARMAEGPHDYKLCDGRNAFAQAYDRAREIGVSIKTMEEIDDIAPHWDIHSLMNRYYMRLATQQMQPGEHPNAAYRGWVKKFTKGKAPS